ncbi:MAG: spermidine/putrescine transport system substrate-binding protein [Halioglobus sp.]|jgi:spermidine/putrescine transport system substrate-binding protein
MRAIVGNVIPRHFLKQLALLLWVPLSPAMAADLIIYTWDDYITESLVSQFEQQTGHTLKFKYFQSDLERDTNISDAAVEFDIAITDAYTLQGFENSGFFGDIDKGLYTNHKHLASRWRDTCGPQGVPFFWGGVGIAYRASQIIVPVDSWGQLLVPEPALRGRITMLYDTFDLLLPPLKMLGYSGNTVEADELKQAYNLLQKQQDYVADYTSSYGAVVSLPQGNELAMVQAHSGDQLILADLTGHEDWKFVYPKEGTSIWMDCISISASIRSLSAAYELVEFLLDPAVAAQLAEEIDIASPNESALALVGPQYLNDTSIFIPEAVLELTEEQRDRSIDIQAIRNKVLLSLKNKK